MIWAALAVAVVAPAVVAAMSPLLAWRDAAYIAAGFAGVLSMSLLLLQPLLAGGYLPGVTARGGRRLHAWGGAALVVVIVVHVVGLWITSPPDVVDALLFRSPTPFSAWGVAAMWAVFAAALLALARRRFRPVLWRLCHAAIATVIVVGGVVHAMLIEGTMETVSKTVLCALVIAAWARLMVDLRLTKLLRRRAR